MFALSDFLLTVQFHHSFFFLGMWPKTLLITHYEACLSHIGSEACVYVCSSGQQVFSVICAVKKCTTFKQSVKVIKASLLNLTDDYGDPVPEGKHENVHGCFSYSLSFELINLCSSKYRGEPETCSLFCVIRCDMRAALIKSD